MNCEICEKNSDTKHVIIKTLFPYYTVAGFMLCSSCAYNNVIIYVNDKFPKDYILRRIRKLKLEKLLCLK